MDIRSEFLSILLFLLQLLSLLFEDLFKRFNAEVNINKKLMIGVLSGLYYFILRGKKFPFFLLPIEKHCNVLIFLRKPFFMKFGLSLDSG